MEPYHIPQPNAAPQLSTRFIVGTDAANHDASMDAEKAAGVHLLLQSLAEPIRSHVARENLQKLLTSKIP